MALQNAATATSIFAELALVGASAQEMGQHLFAATKRRVQDVFDSYRPELHYMRGPGPKWREKHGTGSSRFGASEAPAPTSLRPRHAAQT
jgi:hypothetical protein